MKTLAAQISKLLFEHDCVIVPGLGGFITNYKPAIIHPQHHTFHPPSKQIIFNAALNSNDGILINAYCGIFETDFTTAAKIIDQKVHAIRISLLNMFRSKEKLTFKFVFLIGAFFIFCC